MSASIDNYKCSFCNRKYKLKENFDKHHIVCIMIHEMKNKSHDDMVDSMETLPSQRELFQLIKAVMVKNEVLENELKQIKKMVSVRHKRDVLEYLNHKKEYGKTFIEWYKSFTVDSDDLQLALDTDLTKAIQQIIHKSSLSNTGSRPLCWFKEKQNHLYLLDSCNGEPKKWRLATHQDIEKMVVFLSNSLLKKFVHWQNENMEFLTANDKNKDLEIIYMSKITGIKNPIDKRTFDVKKWLYSFPLIREDTNDVKEQ